jgi:hypothetical protein
LRTAARAIGFGRRVPLAARSDARRPVLQVIENIGGPGRTRTSDQTVMSALTDEEKPAKSSKRDDD